MIWDLGPFRDSDRPRTEAAVQEWSATAAPLGLGGRTPPVFVARAGRDGSRIKAGTDEFVARALGLDLDVEVRNHPTGQHGFDIRDDDARSREIIAAALDFFAERLEASVR